MDGGAESSGPDTATLANATDSNLAGWLATDPRGFGAALAEVVGQSTTLDLVVTGKVVHMDVADAIIARAIERLPFGRLEPHLVTMKDADPPYGAVTFVLVNTAHGDRCIDARGVSTVEQLGEHMHNRREMRHAQVSSVPVEVPVDDVAISQLRDHLHAALSGELAAIENARALQDRAATRELGDLAEELEVDLFHAVDHVGRRAVENAERDGTYAQVGFLVGQDGHLKTRQTIGDAFVIDRSIEGLRGAFHNGYDPTSVNTVLGHLKEECGVEVICVWERGDGTDTGEHGEHDVKAAGLGGNSELYIRQDDRLHELAGDLRAWLTGDPADPATPRWPGPPATWTGAAGRRAGDYPVRFGQNFAEQRHLPRSADSTQPTSARRRPPAVRANQRPYPYRAGPPGPAGPDSATR